MEENNQRLIAELGSYKNMKGLRRSAPFRRHQATLRKLFKLARTYTEESARPRLKSFLRVAAWNIECGKKFDGIAHTLNTHPILRFADLILLNEVDDGMARSGNRSVAADLGREIGAHAIYGVEYLEFSGSESIDGHVQENTTALHGNAILTRHPFGGPRLIRLPRCERNFESAQKRLGGRLGLVVDLQLGPTRFAAATTHLDVVNGPSCRRKQLSALLHYLDADKQIPAILGGDLNTHTFSRGGKIRALKNLARLLVNPEAVTRGLLEPFKSEPALRELELFEFRLQGFNDDRYTCRVDDSELLRSSGLPAPVRGFVRRRFGDDEVSLDFRLDWLAGRHLRSLSGGEITDSATGVSSVPAQTITGIEYQG